MTPYETARRIELVYKTRMTGPLGQWQKLDDHGMCGVTLPDGRQFGVHAASSHYPWYTVIAVPGGAYCSGPTIELAATQLLAKLS